MTNAETTEKAVTVAEQGAHVAPETVPSKKGARKRGGTPKIRKPTRNATTQTRHPSQRCKLLTERYCTTPQSQTPRTLYSCQL